MSPQRARMIDDMILAGLAEGTQKLYVQAVRRLPLHAGHSKPRGQRAATTIARHCSSVPYCCSNAGSLRPFWNCTTLRAIVTGAKAWATTPVSLGSG